MFHNLCHLFLLCCCFGDSFHARAQTVGKDIRRQQQSKKKPRFPVIESANFITRGGARIRPIEFNARPSESFGPTAAPTSNYGEHAEWLLQQQQYEQQQHEQKHFHSSDPLKPKIFRRSNNKFGILPSFVSTES